MDKIFGKIDFKKFFSFFSRSLSVKSDGSNILEMDLIKDEVPVIFDRKKHFTTLAFFVGLALILMGELYYLLDVWEKNQLYNKSEYLQPQIAEINKKINEIRIIAGEAGKFRDDLNIFTPVFRQHIYFNNFFTWLEKYTLKDVYYSNFNGDTSGNYTLNAVAKDFRSLPYQLETIRSSQEVSSVAISSEKIESAESSNKNPGATFDLNLKIKSGLFVR